MIGFGCFCLDLALDFWQRFEVDYILALSVALCRIQVRLGLGMGSGLV